MRSEMQKNNGRELSDAELDAVTGGCSGQTSRCGGGGPTPPNNWTLEGILEVWDKCMRIASSQ